MTGPHCGSRIRSLAGPSGCTTPGPGRAPMRSSSRSRASQQPLYAARGAHRARAHGLGAAYPGPETGSAHPFGLHVQELWSDGWSDDHGARALADHWSAHHSEGAQRDARGRPCALQAQGTLRVLRHPSRRARAGTPLLERLEAALPTPAYNLFMCSGPSRDHRPGYWDTLDEDFHWHIAVLPRLMRPTMRVLTSTPAGGATGVRLDASVTLDLGSAVDRARSNGACICSQSRTG